MTKLKNMSLRENVTHRLKRRAESIENGDESSAPQTKKYSGLENLGSTCYLNTVLQILFMTESFREAVKRLDDTENLSYDLKRLFQNLESRGKLSTKQITERITHTLAIENVNKQQDAAEFLHKILSMVTPNLSKIFQGKEKHSRTCLRRSHQSFEEEKSFFVFPIAVDSDRSNEMNLQKRFDDHFEANVLSEDDQLFCEHCETMTDMETNSTIVESPQVLALHLQRFYLDYIFMTYVKNNCCVEIPFKLSVKDEHVSHTYDLCGVVNHIGTRSGGHYYAYIKSFEDQRWYTFNDYEVKKTLDFTGESMFSKKAYLLLYKKCTQSADLKLCNSKVPEECAEKENSEPAEDLQNALDDGTSSKFESPWKIEKKTRNPSDADDSHKKHDIKVTSQTDYNSENADQQTPFLSCRSDYRSTPDSNVQPILGAKPFDAIANTDLELENDPLNRKQVDTSLKGNTCPTSQKTENNRCKKNCCIIGLPLFCVFSFFLAVVFMLHSIGIL